ncbi:hypothetical protein [Thermococcus sp. 2319x1]|uniref:hypothetical protein n=1 Tax=Thermococcus sp. 2319x1 TaxID=1674923 RepID=UPI00073D84EB|nr:hypothetical protein [Thermococcus sp. 2319x1]
MKKLLALLVGVLIIVIGIQQVIAGNDCEYCEWPPSSWTLVSVDYTTDYAYTEQKFKWDWEHLQALWSYPDEDYH